jgi:hypothetical protein
MKRDLIKLEEGSFDEVWLSMGPEGGKGYFPELPEI